jgi:hypothetical protein
LHGCTYRIPEQIVVIAVGAVKALMRFGKAKMLMSERRGRLRTVDAQRSLFSFEESPAVSEAGVTANLVRLYQALGGGWQSMSLLSEVSSEGDEANRPQAADPDQSKLYFSVAVETHCNSVLLPERPLHEFGNRHSRECLNEPRWLSDDGREGV